MRRCRAKHAFIIGIVSVLPLKEEAPEVLFGDIELGVKRLSWHDVRVLDVKNVCKQSNLELRKTGGSEAKCVVRLLMMRERPSMDPSDAEARAKWG